MVNNIRDILYKYGIAGYDNDDMTNDLFNLFISKLKETQKEYIQKVNECKLICDKQSNNDTSFEAEVEDEILFISEKQLEVINDIIEKLNK